MNKREYLRSLGFTVGERGRFSAEMLKALADAPAGAVTEDAKPAPKPRAKREPKPGTVTVAKVEARRPSPLDMPKRRPENTGFTVVGGTLIRQDVCGKCTARVSRCACDTGPQAYKWLSKEAGKPLVLTLDKPASLATA